MSGLLQRIAAIQQALAPQQSAASHITLAPARHTGPQAGDDISEQSPQSVNQGQYARPDQNAPVSSEDLDRQGEQLATASGGGSISINGQDYSTGGGGGTDLTTALGGVYNQLRPAAQSHALTRKMVQDAVSATVTDVTKDQLGISRAARDVSAALQQQANGTLSAEAYGEIRKQAASGQAGYTLSQLARAPGGAEFLGIQSEIQDAREQQLQAYAKSNGWDRTEVKWDDKQNQPSPDYQAADFNFRRAQKADLEAKSQHYPDKVKADQRTASINAIDKAISHFNKLRMDTMSTGGDTAAIDNQIQNWNGQLQKLVGDDGLGNTSQPAAPAGKPVAPQAAPAAGANGAPSISLNSVDELRAGLASNKWKPGTILQIGSEKGVVTGDPNGPALKPIQ